ncbi:MAG: adenylate/guanylate cyclase domain-containing protein [Chthoniobacteraceae bacterium]
MRYLKITLLVGFLVSIFVAGLYELGAFMHLDLGLWNFMGQLSGHPPKHTWVQYVLFVFLAFGIAWTTVDINRPSLKAVVAAGALIQMLGVPWVLNFFHYFFSPFPGSLAVVLSFGAGFAYSRSDAGKRKRTLRTVFGDRLSKKSFVTLVNSDTLLNFQGELRETTIVVCELFNHDALAEALPIADYVAMTNTFLDACSDFLVDKDGYLDECDGESVRVIFGAPLEDKSHAAKGCQAALELSKRLENVNLECEIKWHHKFDFRIGVNSGEVVTAAYGSKRLGSFSVAGESVEFARRLCSANMIYGSRLLIGPETYALAAESIEVRPIELIRGKTVHSCEEIYEILGMKNVLSAEDLHKRDLFWKGIVYYREKQWEDALDHFAAALSIAQPDAPIEYYIRRIEHLRTGTPTLDWENARI